MGASNLIKYMNRKVLLSKTIGGKVRLDSLENGEHFFLDVHGGVIGKIVSVGLNTSVKWLNHPDKPISRIEWIASGTQVKRYNHE